MKKKMKQVTTYMILPDHLVIGGGDHR